MDFIPQSILFPGYITLSLESVTFEFSKLHTRVVKFNLFFLVCRVVELKRG